MGRETTAEKFAREWWRKEGRFIDPDTSDVPWEDKRGELAMMAYMAGLRKGWETSIPVAAVEPIIADGAQGRTKR